MIAPKNVKEDGHAYYLPLTPKKLQSATRRVTDALKKSRRKFDGIACRGISGLSVASPVALRLRKPLAVIRKGECANSNRDVEVGGDMRRYVIVDDLIHSGATVARIKEAMQPAKCVGVYLYDSSEGYDDGYDDDKSHSVGVKVHSLGPL